MINKVHWKSLLLAAMLSLAPISYSAVSENAGYLFFMGEDIIHPQGMIISVNEVESSLYSGGLGVSGQKEDIKVNLTLMNNGHQDQKINPAEDFLLDVAGLTYKPIHQEENPTSLNEITLGAGTQTRLNLSFRSEPKENDTPELLFKMNDSALRIVCDPKLGEIVSATDINQYNRENIAKAAKFLADAGRLTASKNICESMLARNRFDSTFLLIMAIIYESVEDQEKARYYLEKIDVTKMSGAEEAEEVAKMAMSIGNNDIAVNVLASFDNAGLLNQQQRALKARAYYYEDMLDHAERTLNSLFEEGYKDCKAYFTMGNLFNKRRDSSKAIYYWEKALEMNPQYSEALFNIGVGYYNNGDMYKARSYWEKVLRSSPDSSTMAAAEEALKGTEF